MADNESYSKNLMNAKAMTITHALAADSHFALCGGLSQEKPGDVLE
jgi:hypothetical protein